LPFASPGRAFLSATIQAPRLSANQALPGRYGATAIWNEVARKVEAGIE
jgi:hypothetical protein